MPLSLPRRHPDASWPTLVVTTILGIQLLVLMEWIFFVTKPSFLSVLDVGSRLSVLALTSLPMLALAAGLLAPLALVARLLRSRPDAARIVGRVAALVPVVVFGSLFVLMADNFANTVLGWSIERSAGVGRVVAAAVVLLAFVSGFYVVAGWLRFFAGHTRLGVGIAGTCVALSLMALMGGTGGRGSSGGIGGLSSAGLASTPPNILLLGSDGLNATHLSAYGYERATTPYLEALVPYSLFCENSFANCGHTTGSLVSMLTGRLPTETRVTYPPDILTGEQSYLHLPGLLKQVGYTTEQISIRHYGDAFDANMREGFDRAAFRGRGTAQASARFGGFLGQEAAFFGETIVDRIRGRLVHTAGLGGLPSAYQEAVHADRLAGHTDADRFKGLSEALRTTREPFFIHTHFMATHGAHFSPSAPRFSDGQTQDQDWMLDFYDDAILEFDGAVGSLVEVLRERGVLDNTLIVIYSDHGMRSDARLRTPLMFVFPGGEHAGRLEANVQNLDIAPTVIDYLGLEVPQWMHGRSLLAGPMPTLRPVFSTGFRGDALRRLVPGGPFEVDPGAAGPPFHSMGRLSMIVGQRVYTLDLVQPGLEVHDLPDHAAPCPESDLPDAKAAARQLVDHLRQRDWDVAGLPNPLPLVAAR